MNELFNIVFKPLVTALTRRFKETVFTILMIVAIWAISVNREDQNNNKDDCQVQLKEAQEELKDTRKQLLQAVLQSKAQDANTARNDEQLRQQSEKDIKQVMP
jgi:mannitol-1-phosphate/altronate dehydrogenase